METKEQNPKFTYFTDDGLEFTLQIPKYWNTIYKGKPRERLYQEYINMLNWVKKVPKDKVILDIGVNHSLFSTPVSLLGYQVLGFEPVKANFDSSVNNMTINNCKNWKLFNIALYNEEGRTQIFVPECPDNSSLSKEAAVANMIGKEYTPEVVDTARFDFFIKNNPEFNNIGFIKIDTQGSEYQILEGMKEFLSQTEDIYLIAEFEPHLNKMGHTYEELDNLIKSFGFKQISQISNDKLYYKN